MQTSAREALRHRIPTLRRACTVVAALVATLGLAAPAAAAAPSASIRSTPARSAPARVSFGIGPASAKGLDADQGAFTFSLSPGARFTEHVGVINYSSKPLDLTVYAADALTTPTGQIGYDPRSAPGDDARTWLTFGLSHARMLTVLARPRVVTVLPVYVAAPRSATPGDHLVGIFASLLVKATGTGTRSVSPTFEQRVATRAFFRVTGPLRPELSVEHLHADYSGTANPFGTGTVTVTYTVANHGNVDLGGRQSVVLTGLFGSSGLVPKLPQIPVLLPGSSYPMRLRVIGVWPELMMHARVRVTGLGVVGAVNPVSAPFTAQTAFVAVSWSLLGLLVVIIASGIGVIRWRGRHPSTARHRGGEGETRVPALAGRA